MKPMIFMFSGQGSHYYQMGRELYHTSTVFQYWMKKADDICQDLIGLSVINELYGDHNKKSDPFSRTLLTHPAIFMVEYALAQTLFSEGILPHKVLGTSLGEFTAAALANVLSFEKILQAVIYQAKIIEANCRLGAMMAILHAPALYDHSFLKLNGELASINFSSHFVVSGDCNKLNNIKQYLKEQRITYQMLSVNHAFHSSELNPISSDFIDFIKKESLHAPCIPLVSCEKTHALDNIKHEHFWEIVRKPIQFQTTIQALEREDHYIYLDAGPSGTLATFVKYNLASSSQSKAFAILTPFQTTIPDFAYLRETLNR